VLSIEGQLNDGSISNPISTIVAHSIARHPMYFELNAATKVAFFGDRFLHGYVSHQFAGQSATQLSLCARARQFSRYTFINNLFIIYCLLLLLFSNLLILLIFICYFIILFINIKLTNYILFYFMLFNLISH
jgi:hypothetical protein